MCDDDQRQDSDQDAGAELEIPRELAIEQQSVPFLGDALAAAMTAGGAIYITLQGVCWTLGHSKASRAVSSFRPRGGW